MGHLAAHWSKKLHCLHFGLILVLSAEGNLLGYLAVVHKAMPPESFHLNEHTKWPNIPHCRSVYAAWLWRIILQVGGMLSGGPADVIFPGLPGVDSPRAVVSPWAAPRKKCIWCIDTSASCSGLRKIKHILNS